MKKSASALANKIIQKVASLMAKEAQRPSPELISGMKAFGRGRQQQHRQNILGNTQSTMESLPNTNNPPPRLTPSKGPVFPGAGRPGF